MDSCGGHLELSFKFEKGPALEKQSQEPLAGASTFTKTNNTAQQSSFYRAAVVGFVQSFRTAA